MHVYNEIDKIRFSNDNPGFVIRHIECSDKRSFQNFITFWIVAGAEDTLLPQVENKLWKSKEGRYYHNEKIFHREGSAWCDLRHHYHVMVDSIPDLNALYWFFEIINSAGEHYINPDLQAEILGFFANEGSNCESKNI